MADVKKSTKKVAAKKAVEVKSTADLQKTLAEKQKDLLESMRSHKSGELVNPRVLGGLRKEIARLHTAIRAAALDAKESK
ncbi:MAG TPA: 50S ribosomal protein L29 [Candidatus Saccharimonas sp.]|jgi:ribosomal protein L29|nr:50S ribosomal protein L29 [Candidatus Saccharimonas sp.]